MLKLSAVVALFLSSPSFAQTLQIPVPQPETTPENIPEGAPEGWYRPFRVVADQPHWLIHDDSLRRLVAERQAREACEKDYNQCLLHRQEDIARMQTGKTGWTNPWVQVTLIVLPVLTAVAAKIFDDKVLD